MNKRLTLFQYRRLRAIYLRMARSFRLGSVWGPADRAQLRIVQQQIVALRAARR